MKPAWRPTRECGPPAVAPRGPRKLLPTCTARHGQRARMHRITLVLLLARRQLTSSHWFHRPFLLPPPLLRVAGPSQTSTAWPRRQPAQNFQLLKSRQGSVMISATWQPAPVQGRFGNIQRVVTSSLPYDYGHQLPSKQCSWFRGTLPICMASPLHQPKRGFGVSKRRAACLSGRGRAAF